MDKCKPLAEYAILVAKAREYLANGMEFSEAIDEAVNWCINNDCMVQYLRKHREEVTDMWLTEYNEEEVQEAMRLNGLAEGRAQGLAEGRAEGLAEGLAEGREQGLAEGQAQTRAEDVDAIISSMGLSLEEACKVLNVTVDEYKETKAQYQEN